MAEDEVKLRLQAEAFGYRKAWADVRTQTARDLANIKSTVTTSLNQTRVAAAQSLSGIRQAAATNLSQTRVNTAQQLSAIRVQTAQQLNQIRNTAARTLGQMGSQFESAGRRMSVGLTLPLIALGAAAVKSAKDIDSQVNTLRALTGSAEAAEKRYAQLVATAQKTPGLTTNLGLTLDAQLRAAKVTEETIDRILPAIGRLNAIKPIEDPQRFADNLRQIIQLNFPVKDLRELVRASPIAGQVLTELFNVDSPTNAEAIRAAAKRMGIRTTDEFFAAFADAAARNKGLQNVTDSIGTAFAKMADRVEVSLRPLGLAIIDAFKPILDFALPMLESLGKTFNALPTPVKTVIVVIGGLAASIGPVLLLAGSLISTVASLRTAFVTLNTAGLIPTIANMRLASQAVQGAGTAAAVSAGGWLGLGAAILAAVAAAGALGFAWARLTGAGTQAEGVMARLTRVFYPLVGVAGTLGFLLGEGTAKTKDLSASQAAAVPPVRTFTDTIEEEAESLKQLRRALAEVELATKSRIAAAQRAYSEERTTLAQFTAERIRAIEDEKKAKLAEIDEQLRLRQAEVEAQQGRAQGLGPHGAVNKELKDAIDAIDELKLKRKEAVGEAEVEVASLRSEQRQKERDNEERHRESILAVQRTNAERQIELLRDAAEQNESLRLDSERKIVAIERRVTDAEVAEIRRRADAASQGTEGRVRLEDELAQKLAERGRQRAEQARRIARAELEAALLPVKREGLREGARGASDEGVIARLRDAVERGAASVAQTEQQIGSIIDASFARRIKNLKDEIAIRAKYNQDVAELNAQLAQLEQERTNASEDTARRVRGGQKDDTERQRENLNRLLPIERAVAAARLATRKALSDATRFIFGREREFITERYAIEREQIELAHREALSDLNDREHEELLYARRTLGNDEAFNARRLEIQKNYDALRAEQAKQTRLAEEENERQKRQDLELQDPTSGRSLFGNVFGDALSQGLTQWQAFGTTVSSILADLSAQAGNFGTIITSVFEAVGQAVGSAVKSFVLLGTAGGGARKWAAEVIAAVAQMAAVKSVFELAEGFAALARAFFGDPKAGAEAGAHFHAAAIYGSVAAIAAVAGRIVAGNAFKQGGAGALADGGGGGGSSSGAGDSDRDRTIREGRYGGAPDPNVVPQHQVPLGDLNIKIDLGDGHVEQKVVRIFKSNGSLRATLRHDMLSEAPGG
ncbi:MAG TPA: hypothetical protein VF297_05255 [Pyrinomonadaceae bacterium]